MKKTIILAVASLVLFSCSSDDSSDTETPEQAPTVEQANQTITYDADVAPLIASRCFQCHNNPTANGAPRSSTWVNFDIVSSNAARINARVANGSMPPSRGLAQAERDLIAQWIADGMLEN